MWSRRFRVRSPGARTVSALVALCVVLFAAGPTRAAYAAPADVGDLELHGFLVGNLSGRTAERGPGGRRLLLAEERARLDVEWWADEAELSALLKADLIHDAVAGEWDLDLREGYLQYRIGPLDLRAGRQVVTWGVGDLLFINDVFPKDWVSFFSGRPLEYLKLGVDGLRATFYSRAADVEVVVLPRFEPDKLPARDRFFLFDPLAAVTDREEVRPSTSLDDTEVAVRLYRRLGRFEISGYAYRGFWRAPAARTEEVRPRRPPQPAGVVLRYPELSVYGASLQGGVLEGIVSLEFGYYDSRRDPAGTDPSVPNSQVRFLVGYQRQLMEDFTVGLQYYVEGMRHHDAYMASLPAGLPPAGSYRDTVAVRLTRWLRHRTLRLSLFAFYSPVDADYLLQPEGWYRFGHGLSVTAGANLFGGSDPTSFLGQFDRDDNAYVAVRFDF